MSFNQLGPDGVDELLEQVGRVESQNVAVVIATPTPFHLKYASNLLKRGQVVGIEKPLSANGVALSKFFSEVRSGVFDAPFVFQYYLLEKSLPLFALFNEDSLVDSQRCCLKILNGLELLEVRSELGEIVSIEGVLIEGDDHRNWVNTDEAGGHTLETFSHLLAVVLAMVGKLSIVDYWMGASRDSRACGFETVMFGKFETDCGAPVLLGCAKEQVDAVRSRWLKVRCERGELLMDFQSQTLSIESDAEHTKVSMHSTQPYVSLLNQFIGYIHGERSAKSFEIAVESCLLAIKCREQGVLNGIKLAKPIERGSNVNSVFSAALGV